MNRTSWLEVLVVAALCTPVVTTAAERLNVKTGLWEITSVTQFSGVPPLPKELMDKLTPEQRAKMVADLKAESAKPSRDTSRECITEKDLDRPLGSADAKNCKQTLVSTTRTSQEARIVCDGETKGSGVLKVSTPTPQTMNGTLNLKTGEGPDAFIIKGTLSGRWLSADCGDEAESDLDSAADADDEDVPSDDSEEEEE
jgi:hypothetical protein